MNRAGVSWTGVGELHDDIAAYPPEGVFTHFHSAELEDGSREQQEERFAKVLASLPARPEVVHAENSPGVAHRGPNYSSQWTFARPGIFLYGVGSGPTADIKPDPVVSMRARVVDVRIVPDGETISYDATYRAVGSRRIATLAVGYADGYRRALSNVGTVLVRGRRAPVAGLVTMDMTMIDVTDVPCEIGDVATLIGHDGADQIDVEELASTANLSPYEVLTGLRARLPRRYVDADVDTARASA
jgi:alanine racemase